LKELRDGSEEAAEKRKKKKKAMRRKEEKATKDISERVRNKKIKSIHDSCSL